MNQRSLEDLEPGPDIRSLIVRVLLGCLLHLSKLKANFERFQIFYKKGWVHLVLVQGEVGAGEEEEEVGEGAEEVFPLVEEEEEHQEDVEVGVVEGEEEEAWEAERKLLWSHTDMKECLLLEERRMHW